MEKQLDIYLRDLQVSDTIVIRDREKNGEESYEEIMNDTPDVDTLIDMVHLYQ